MERIAVLGAGKSGLEVARWAVAHGLECVLSDVRPMTEWPHELVHWCRDNGVRIDAGGHSREAILSCRIIVPSPGVPLDIPVLQEARARKIPLVGELALALSLWRGPTLGITGTNGKTTCTALVAEMLKNSNIDAVVGGNIGTPLLGRASESGTRCLVAEVSSFQLDLFPSVEEWRLIGPFLHRISGYSPSYPGFDVAVLLNIAQDHLERYGEPGDYVRSKAGIFSGQPPAGWAIVEEAALDLVTELGLEPRAKMLLIRPQPRNSRLLITWPGGEKESYDMSRFRLMGRHNLYNLTAAIYGARILGAGKPGIQAVIDTFRPLGHRLEFVAQRDGIVFIDDSKATNLHATLASVDAVDAPVVLICGGISKGQDFDGLQDPQVRRRLRGVVFLGDVDVGLKEALDGVPGVHINGRGHGWEKMQRAVRAAYAMAHPGDVVLLSPACASFDLYSGYSERGDAFKAAVKVVISHEDLPAGRQVRKD